MKPEPGCFYDMNNEKHIAADIRSNAVCFCAGDRIIATVPFCAGAADRYERVEGEDAWLITRTCDAPVQDMRIDMQSGGKPDFWLVPGVNYNGNGWCVKY